MKKFTRATGNINGKTALYINATQTKATIYATLASKINSGPV
jgi:hypothetical protein